jgi:hypothetical protein
MATVEDNKKTVEPTLFHPGIRDMARLVLDVDAQSAHQVIVERKWDIARKLGELSRIQELSVDERRFVNFLEFFVHQRSR